VKIGTKNNTIIEKCIYAFFLQKEPHFEKIFETTFFHFQKKIMYIHLFLNVCGCMHGCIYFGGAVKQLMKARLYGVCEKARR
jgi:hypothetical protein